MKQSLKQNKVLDNVINFLEVQKDETQKGLLCTLKSGSDKKYFITVGACHLVGKNSIIDLLEKENYKVERL
jgi:uncharacterized protein YbaP (TraB family)